MNTIQCQPCLFRWWMLFDCVSETWWFIAKSIRQATDSIDSYFIALSTWITFSVRNGNRCTYFKRSRRSALKIEASRIIYLQRTGLYKIMNYSPSSNTLSSNRNYNNDCSYFQTSRKLLIREFFIILITSFVIFAFLSTIRWGIYWKTCWNIHAFYVSSVILLLKK